MELYLGENINLHRVCDALLDVFLEHADEWKQVIRKKKFDKFNQDWKALENQTESYE